MMARTFPEAWQIVLHPYSAIAPSFVFYICSAHVRGLDTHHLPDLKQERRCEVNGNGPRYNCVRHHDKYEDADHKGCCHG
jgi:hypothetical protein